MRRTRFRCSAIAVTVAVIASSCGSDRAAAPAGTAAATTTAAPAPASVAVTTPGSADIPTASTATVVTTPPTQPPPAVPMFGDAPWPCGPAAVANTDTGTEKGVTANSINIATGDDAGYAGSPGLNHEMTDAMKAMVAKCNELGGINGRKITLNYFDAGLFNVGPAIQGACDGNNFFLVGEGWAFDSNQEETRLGCGMPAVPTYSVSAAFAHGKDVFPPVPNPSDELSAGYYEQIATLFPDAVKKVATLVGSFTATQESRDKVVAVAPQFGWHFVSTTIEYNPAGEADWTPFVKQIRDSGATMVYWSGTCLPGLQLFAQTAKANGLDVPIIADANHYAGTCRDANANGAMDNVYVRLAGIPFEEADTNAATKDYLDLVAASGGDTAMLGTQTASAFLLWATAAAACGPELTRACTLTNLKNTTSWTGHGLHAETNPGQNHPPNCNMVIKLHGTAYERVTPAERGTFECKPTWVAKVSGTPALAAALLDANRISQQFAPK